MLLAVREYTVTSTSKRCAPYTTRCDAHCDRFTVHQRKQIITLYMHYGYMQIIGRKYRRQILSQLRHESLVGIVRMTEQFRIEQHAGAIHRRQPE